MIDVKNFCILNQISKKSIKYMDAPPIIFEHILIDNNFLCFKDTRSEYEIVFILNSILFSNKKSDKKNIKSNK